MKFFQRKNHLALYVIAVTFVLVVSGCAKTKRLTNAGDIHAYDDSNVVFFGYDIYVPDSRIKGIRFTCTNEDTEKNDEYFWCFPINTTMGVANYSGADIYKIKFGRYKIHNLVYTIKTGEETTTTEHYKGGKYQYSTHSTTDITKECVMTTEFNRQFYVTKNHAPYLGHLVVFGKYTENNCDPVDKSIILDMYNKDIDKIEDRSLKNAVKAHIDYR